MQTEFGKLSPQPLLDHLDLAAPAVAAAATSWEYGGSIQVVEIDPDLADTAAMTEAYDVPLTMSANCVVVVGKREGVERIAACVVRADTRANVNYVVKRLLDVRKATFLSMERAVEETGMEYGGITPIGLPPAWRLFVAAEVAVIDHVLVGSGVRRSKLILPGAAIAALPGVEVIDDLAMS